MDWNISEEGFIISDKINHYTSVNYTKSREDAIEPTMGTAEAAGYDLYVPSNYGDIVLNPGETELIDTGIVVEFPKCTFGGVFSRSGIAARHNLRLADSVGVIDSDYRGSIIVSLYNDSNETKTVKAGERVAQLVIIPYIPIKLEYVESIDKDTERGTNGLGSTGK